MLTEQSHFALLRSELVYRLVAVLYYKYVEVK